MNPKCFVQITI